MQTNSGYAEINHAKLYYQIAGEGRPVVFVHAGVADHRMWDDQVRVFSRKYRTLRYDLGGFGDSAPVPGNFAHRDDLFELMRFFNMEPAYLIGCSMGGGIVMDFALEHSEMAKALVMVGSAPSGLDLGLDVPAKLIELERTEEAGDWETFLELSAQVWFDGEGRRPDQVNKEKGALVVEMQRKAVKYRSDDQGRSIPLEPPAAKRLNELHLPVLAVCADRDLPYLQKAAQHMAEHISGAEKVIIHDTAHLPSMERPEEFNRIVLGFLRSLLQP